MISPYSDLYNWFRVDDQLLLELEETPEEDRPRIFLGRFPPEIVKSPYDFFSYVYGEHYPRQTTVDVPSLTLDYIVEHHLRWDPDEVACFLLEVAEDHGHLSGTLDWLKAVNMPDMLEWPHANQMIWEMFYDERDDLILKLGYHYGWQEALAEPFKQELAQSNPNEDADRYYYKYALIRMLEAKELVSTQHQPAVGLLAQGLVAKHEHRFWEAIPNLLEFHAACPETASQEIRTALAACYLEVGWRGLALEWVMEAIKYDLDNSELEDLQERILAPDSERLQRIEHELDTHSRFRSPSARKSLAVAEFLYRYYGRMLHDYSPVIAGYSRAVEIELREHLLPRVREWIQCYGNSTDAGRRWIRLGDKKLYQDVHQERVTLGTWQLLFHESAPRQLKHTAGEFYHCIHRQYGATIEFAQLARFGSLLGELTEFRNEASHNSVNDWGAVLRVRSILLREKPFNLLRSTAGSLLR